MKKLIPVLTGAIMLLSLAACGSRTAAPEATTAPAAAGGKTLVVYFSATGSTKTAAEAIAAATGGDLLELEPAEPYTSADLDYNNADSRVSREHDDETLRDVALKTTTADNWADYDTVYIGYPIWWGIAAWPVDTFVKANDFTGKTVIPFCTSASSGLGQSGTLLAEAAGTGEWLEGAREENSPLLKYTVPLPQRPQLIMNARSEAFHPGWPIRVNARHILEDTENLSRIPQALQSFGNLPLLLDAAVELGRRQALAEPGIIAPQFYHGRMQFLMPLYLSGRQKADLAMALSIGDGYYIGETCLTPQMAYLNARLLARPTAGWLREQT